MFIRYALLTIPLLLAILAKCSEHYTFSIVPATEFQKGGFWSNFAKQHHVAIRRDAFPSRISNFDLVVAPFVAQKCGVYIDKFFYVDLPKVTGPVYLRKPELAYILKYWDKSVNPVWVLEAKVHENITLDYKGLQRLQFYKLISYTLYPKNDDNHNTYPLLRPTNFFHHSAHAKPWNCFVHIVLFPPKLRNFLLSLPPAMWYPCSSEQLANQLPSRVPTIALFMFDSNIHRDTVEENLVLNSNFPSSNGGTYNYVYLTAKVTCNNHFEKKHCFSTATIKNIQVVQLCSACIKDSKLVRGGILEKKVINADTLRSIRTLESLAFSDSSVGIILNLDHSQRSFGTVGGYLYQCSEPASSFFYATSPSTLRLPERRSQARSHVWQSIMKNYSVETLYPDACSNGRTIQSSYWLNINPEIKFIPKLLVNSGQRFRQQFQVGVDNKLDSLQFVSCGKRGYQSISYHELAKIFDKYVWIYLLIIYLGVLPFIVGLLSAIKCSFVETSGIAVHIFLGWKILLEQGDKDLLRFRPLGLKLGVGVIMLLGVVLTNAYKNSNVYNMISNRIPIPYETLDDLAQDKFTVLTRIVKIDVRLFNYLFWKEREHLTGPDLYMFRHEIHDSNEERVVSAYSEVHQLKARSDSGGNSSEVNKLFADSSIYSGVMPLLNRISQAALFAWQSNKTYGG